MLCTVVINLGGVTILGLCPAGMANSMFKLRRHTDRLNFNMELPIPVGRNPNIATPGQYMQMSRCPQCIYILGYISSGQTKSFGSIIANAASRNF